MLDDRPTTEGGKGTTCSRCDRGGGRPHAAGCPDDLGAGGAYAAGWDQAAHAFRLLARWDAEDARLAEDASMKRTRADRFMLHRERRLWDGLEVRPWWRGPVGWRWRLIMAYRALRGYELGGFR